MINIDVRMYISYFLFIIKYNFIKINWYWNNKFEMIIFLNIKYYIFWYIDI